MSSEVDGLPVTVDGLADIEIEAIVAYCAEEVRRQGRGPLEVGGMVNAWLHALRCKAPRLRDIELWGTLIEPKANAEGWRRVQVYVGDHVPPPPQEVPRLMERFVDLLDGMDPEQAYFEFERIHPFRDGNGRTGKIILNHRAGRLRNPIWPPNLWGIANP